MNFSTASHQLRKAIIFALVIETGRNVCFHCGKEICTVEELSIEHKEAWMSAEDPVKAFFSLDNIDFSHLSCNCKAAVRPHKKHANEQERNIARRPKKAEYMRKKYDPEARREKKRVTGH